MWKERENSGKDILALDKIKKLLQEGRRGSESERMNSEEAVQEGRVLWKLKIDVPVTKNLESSDSIAESEKERDQAKIEMECFHKLMYFPGLVGSQDKGKADHQAVCRKIHHCRLLGSQKNVRLKISWNTLVPSNRKH